MKTDEAFILSTCHVIRWSVSVKLRNTETTYREDDKPYISMLPSIFLPVWHVYLVFHVSLVQHCAYAYRVMKVQKLEPGGSCTYSMSALKLCQGGPNLQSNLTTKVKYSTTSNQILEMPTGYCCALC